MANHRTYVVDGKVVHEHEFDDGSVMVTGLDEVLNKENDRSEPADISGVRKTVAIPYLLSCIFISLPILLVIGAFVYAFIYVILNK